LNKELNWKKRKKTRVKYLGVCCDGFICLSASFSGSSFLSFPRT